MDMAIRQKKKNGGKNNLVKYQNLYI